MIDLRDACFDAIYELAKDDPDVVFLTADMGAFALQRFRKDLPRQYFNVGISEQAMISVAAGLAIEGKKVFVYSIAPFVTLRCYEQIKIDLCCMDLSVVIIGIGAGFMYGGDGPTHHSVHDIAVMRALPNMQVLGPCDVVSTRAAVQMAYDSSSSSYIRIERGQLPDLYSSTDAATIGGMSQRLNGTDVAIISTGYMTHRAVAAAEILNASSVTARVIDVLCVHPLDIEKLVSFVKGVTLVVTLEEHSLVGGLGSSVAEVWVDKSINTPLLRLGLPHEFCFTVLDRDALLGQYGLDPKMIASKVSKRLSTISSGIGEGYGS